MSQYQNTILITGGTTGLGYECALAIAKQSPDSLVVIASRSNTDNAAAKLNAATGQSNTVYQRLDLSSRAGVHEFVSGFTSASRPPISALVLNAGLHFSGTVEYSDDGYEKTFAVNHFGHALLFYLLRPQLAADARIVITSSATHDPAQKTKYPEARYTSAAELAVPSTAAAKEIHGSQRYSTSKLCNVLWGYALDRRIKAAGKAWTVTTMDPGLMPGTALGRAYSAPVRFIWGSVMPRMLPLLRIIIHPNTHSVRESGEALARLAVGADVKGVSGRYFEGVKDIRSSEASYDREKQEDLWSWTAKAAAKDDAQAQEYAALA